jgi:hypothetical protein
METPFDTLLANLWQSLRNILDRKAQPNELLLLVYNFSKVARVLYCNMAEASEQMQSNIKARHKDERTKTLTQVEWQEINDDPIRCRLGYMQFIEHINRTGRVLRRKGFTLPLYGRVYFYRNKMVEHWDDYLQLLSASTGDGLVFSGGKIAIPYAFAGIATTNRPDFQRELTDEFAKLGVTLFALEDKWYGEYAEIIYVALEKIDGDLKRIPERLVRLLFKYSFPTPINDLEEYCKTLVAWLETLNLT